MFEDFRKQAEEAALQHEVQDDDLHVENTYPDDGRLFGMTPPQRFVVAMMLLFMTIIIGSLFLVVTSKVALPFLS